MNRELILQKYLERIDRIAEDIPEKTHFTPREIVNIIVTIIEHDFMPIHKYNGGVGATLCHTCRKIITTGLTQDMYCDEHLPEEEEDDDDEEEYRICPSCGGSGEGPADGTTCWRCKGSGE